MKNIGSIDEEWRANKLALILPNIEAVGASVICLSHTFAYFNTIEQWLSQLILFSLSLPCP